MDKVCLADSNPLQTERLSNGNRKLLRELNVKVCDKIITIPKGYETDYSSIPWFGRMFVRWSKVDIAGVVHDWLYETGSISKMDYSDDFDSPEKLLNKLAVKTAYPRELISRKNADDIWLNVAQAGDHHANKFQAWGCWFFLRLGGWYIWNECRQKEEANSGFASVTNIVKLPYLDTLREQIKQINEKETHNLNSYSDLDYMRQLLKENKFESKDTAEFESWEKLPDLALILIEHRVTCLGSCCQWAVFKRDINKYVVLNSITYYLGDNPRTDFDTMQVKKFIEISPLMTASP